MQVCSEGNRLAKGVARSWSEAPTAFSSPRCPGIFTAECICGCIWQRRLTHSQLLLPWAAGRHGTAMGEGAKGPFLFLHSHPAMAESRDLLLLHGDMQKTLSPLCCTSLLLLGDMGRGRDKRALCFPLQPPSYGGDHRTLSPCCISAVIAWGGGRSL